MATQMQPIPIQKVGVFGLNKQDSDSLIELGWATEATNLVFSANGTLQSRKGFSSRVSTGYAKDFHEYVDASGNTLTIFVSGNKIYKITGSVSTDITGTATVSGYGWKFANFNGKCVGYKTGYTPIVLNSISGTFAPATGTMHKGGVVCASNGRVWTVASNTLYWTRLLIHDYVLTEVVGAETVATGAGSLDLSLYWDEGQDSCTGLVEWNNYLVVFGKRSIIILGNPDDANNAMVISENISGTGCINGNTIQKIGNDLFFLSNTGIRSLGRVLQDGSTPLREVSQHVRNYVIDYIEDGVTSCYSKQEGFYLLTYPTAGKTLVFDIRGQLEDGAFRCTEWNKGFFGMISTESGLVLLSDASTIYEYTGYTDTAGAYTITYKGGWSDYNTPYRKIPKRMDLFLTGTAGDSATVYWYYDYLSSTEHTFSTTIRQGNNVHVPLTGSGDVIKLGLSTTVNGSLKSVNKMVVHTKIGRL